MTLSLLLSMFLGFSAQAAELVGRVKTVRQNEVEIEVVGDLLPRIGDNAQILTLVPGIGEQRLKGTWRVSEVRAEVVLATAAAGTEGKPRVGSTVKFDSTDPQPRSALVPGPEPGTSVGRPAIAAANLPSPEDVDWSDPRAPRVFEISCNEGELWDCARLAAKLELGRDIPADSARAAGLFERACNGKIWKACRDAGHLYVQGKDFPRDPSRGAGSATISMLSTISATERSRSSASGVPPCHGSKHVSATRR